MCLRFCKFWTWRLVSICVSFICILVSFIFGPLQTVVYVTDQRSAMSSLLQYETNLAIVLWFIVALMWLVMAANVVLFFGCCLNSYKLIMAYIYIIAIHLIVAFCLCVRYSIECTFLDKKCFDHSSERQGDDSLAVFGIILGFLVYTVAWSVIMFPVENYKMTLI